MSLERYKMVIEELLSEADIRINGDRAWDIHVNNEAFYKRVLSEGRRGLYGWLVAMRCTRGIF